MFLYVILLPSVVGRLEPAATLQIGGSERACLFRFPLCQSWTPPPLLPAKKKKEMFSTAAMTFGLFPKSVRRQIHGMSTLDCSRQSCTSTSRVGLEVPTPIPPAPPPFSGGSAPRNSRKGPHTSKLLQEHLIRMELLTVSSDRSHHTDRDTPNESSVAHV